MSPERGGRADAVSVTKVPSNCRDAVRQGVYARIYGKQMGYSRAGGYLMRRTRANTAKKRRDLPINTAAPAWHES